MDTLRLYGLHDFSGLEETLVALLRTKSTTGRPSLELESIDFQQLTSKRFLFHSGDFLNWELYNDYRECSITLSNALYRASYHDEFLGAWLGGVAKAEENENSESRWLRMISGLGKRLLSKNPIRENFVKTAIQKSDYSIAYDIEYHDGYVSVNVA